MSLREQLLAIRDEHGGVLTPTIVVEEARDPSSPLHHRFEWDDSIAGEAFRRSQAAELIRSVKVKYLPADDKPQTHVRAFHSVKDPVRGQVFDPVEEVAANPLTRKLMLREMERDWRALKARWEHFEEFTALIQKDLAESA